MGAAKPPAIDIKANDADHNHDHQLAFGRGCAAGGAALAIAKPLLGV